MCGIVGYVGERDAVGILLDGLGRLEYRGYDSAGLVVQTGSSLVVRRSVGKIARLRQVIEATPVAGRTALGHTRWATHGRPTESNAHPHATERLAVVHNGKSRIFASCARNWRRRAPSSDRKPTPRLWRIS
jgi:glucosamine--fructose-6-phosphate aminotransferase (isomerizing)